MPEIAVVFYRDDDGSVPVLDWLDGINQPKAVVKCLEKIERLKAEGYSLRRPEADLLRDGIYELRIGLSGINYRLLYFFHGGRLRSSRTASRRRNVYRRRRSNGPSLA
jgi:putative component of toxin-antitoxin plasmid stabilization module